MLYKLLVPVIVLTTLSFVEARPSDNGPPPEFLECLRAHGVSEPATDRLGDSHDVPNEAQCTVKCILDTIGLLKNGKVQMENALNFYHNFDGTKNEAISVLEECDAIGSDDSCETAIKIGLCFQKLDKRKRG